MRVSLNMQLFIYLYIYLGVFGCGFFFSLILFLIFFLPITNFIIPASSKQNIHFVEIMNCFDGSIVLIFFFFFFGCFGKWIWFNLFESSLVGYRIYFYFGNLDRRSSSLIKRQTLHSCVTRSAENSTVLEIIRKNGKENFSKNKQEDEMEKENQRKKEDEWEWGQKIKSWREEKKNDFFFFISNLACCDSQNGGIMLICSFWNRIYICGTCTSCLPNRNSWEINNKKRKKKKFWIFLNFFLNFENQNDRTYYPSFPKPVCLFFHQFHPK